jgi:pimeloyl-ACP methyl ester carboxylesterase
MMTFGIFARRAIRIATALIVILQAAGFAAGAPGPTGPDSIGPVTKSTQYGAVREDFLLGPGRNKGFIIYAGEAASGATRPWIFYAPTFVEPEGGYPDPSHAWLFEKLLAAGFAIAGVDVGESYGNPAGRAVYAGFHRAVTSRYRLAQRACLLPQSRGGLMLYNWAAEHPDCVQCVGGIYTVCDQSSWPGLAVSCPAYGLSEAELRARLRENNPIDRLEPLARAGIAVLHVHGDADTLVPLERNSAELIRRYKALGGNATLVVIKGKGHRVEPEFFQSPDLLAFFLRQGRASLEARPDSTPR